VFPVDASLLDPGTNVLAVELHQNGTNSSDLVFGMRMKIASALQSQSGVMINEVLPGAAGQGFVEFYNPTAAAVNLDGYYLTDTAGNLRKYRIPVVLVPPAGSPHWASPNPASQPPTPSQSIWSALTGSRSTVA